LVWKSLIAEASFVAISRLDKICFPRTSSLIWISFFAKVSSGDISRLNQYFSLIIVSFAYGPTCVELSWNSNYEWGMHR